MNPLSLRFSCVIGVALSVLHVIVIAVVAATQGKAEGQIGALEMTNPGISVREVRTLLFTLQFFTICSNLSTSLAFNSVQIKPSTHTPLRMPVYLCKAATSL